MRLFPVKIAGLEMMEIGGAIKFFYGYRLFPSFFANAVKIHIAPFKKLLIADDGINLNHKCKSGESRRN